MRYMKLIHSSKLPKDENGFTLCRFCNEPVKPPRRTMCSPECAHEIQLRTNQKYLKTCVYQRDKGICAICNVDTKNISKECFNNKENLEKYNISKKRKIYKHKWGGGLWDADHIIPVKNGGGSCGLDNLRTLCINCHKIVTKTSYKQT